MTFRAVLIGLALGVAITCVGGIFWAVRGLAHYLSTGVPGPVFRLHPQIRRDPDAVTLRS